MKITIIGVGGAGCRIADRVLDLVDRDTTVAAVNTDARALQSSRAGIRVQIGSGRTQGLGAGGDAALGRLAASDEVEMIRGLFADTAVVFAVVGLGGGTGSGAAPVLLREAREAGILTICLATMPCAFEGAQRERQAQEALPGLGATADALIVVPGERLFESVGVSDLVGTYERADQRLAACVSSLARLICCPGPISVDFADVQRMIRESDGYCTVGHGEGVGEDKAKDAVASLLESPLTDQGRVIGKAGSLLVSIVGGPDLTVNDVGQVTESLTSRLSDGCKLSVGTVVDDDWQGRLTVTVLASEESRSKPPCKVAEASLEYESGAEKKTRHTRGRRTKADDAQTMLPLDTYGKGRFKDAEPTILDGEDLDIPTFVRRGIAIEK